MKLISISLILEFIEEASVALIRVLKKKAANGLLFIYTQVRYMTLTEQNFRKNQVVE